MLWRWIKSLLKVNNNPNVEFTTETDVLKTEGSILQVDNLKTDSSIIPIDNYKEFCENLIKITNSENFNEMTKIILSLVSSKIEIIKNKTELNTKIFNQDNDCKIHNIRETKFTKGHILKNIYSRRIKNKLPIKIKTFISIINKIFKNFIRSKLVDLLHSNINKCDF